MIEAARLSFQDPFQMDGSSAEKASLRKRQNRRKHQGRVDSATAASLQEAFKREERLFVFRYLQGVRKLITDITMRHAARLGSRTAFEDIVLIH